MQLLGDFDGSSAWELINSLEAHRFGISRIFIHTNSLKCVDPFGRGIFEKNLNDVIGRSVRIVFTGEKASELNLKTVKSTESESDSYDIPMNYPSKS
jgi:hypothetical protein